VLSAQVWIVAAGRLVRYSHSDVPVDHTKHDQAPWITTELWDFGIPPLLQDWKTQPVIDPLTLQFPKQKPSSCATQHRYPRLPSNHPGGAASSDGLMVRVRASAHCRSSIKGGRRCLAGRLRLICPVLGRRLAAGAGRHRDQGKSSNA
jgi:hypothetical protein